MFACIPLILCLLTAAIAVKLDSPAGYSGPVYQDLPPGGAPTPVAAPDAHNQKSTTTVTLTKTVLRNPTATPIAPGKNATSPIGIGSCKNVQSSKVKGDPVRAEAVKEAFLHGWNAWMKYANGFDELGPLTLNGTNNRYGWGLTIVDSIDTAIVMGLADLVSDMLDFVAKVDFTTTDFLGEDPGVQLFGLNILLT